MLKRSFDIVFSGAALIVLSPIFILTSILVFLDLGSPIFFVQERPGLHGKLFRLIKFRTMTIPLENELMHSHEVSRITPLGGFLRASSIDELPELLNVFLGQMSIVGPRPLLVEYLSIYSSYESQRHLVKPGITGLAQINGRNGISWSERFDMDVYYVHHQSFFLDIKILFKTFITVLKRDGINSSPELTMSKFQRHDSGDADK